VLGTETFQSRPALADFCATVKARTGYELAGQKSVMLSPFGVQKYILKIFYRGRIALAGDSAHVMPPFGGQGMNVGWMDAWDLADALSRVIRKGHSAELLLSEYSRHARRRALRAISRAVFNMRAGGVVKFPRIRNGMVWLALHSPLSWFLARFFTARWL
jgi:2-polyprenyl-6-methoxyphenol hydroxylase-like FAD-dependent oxidoreductase